MLISTLGSHAGRTWTFREALFLGQAPDGGLFVPASPPPPPRADRAALPDLDFPGRAFVTARHLLGGEIPGGLVRTITRDALDFPVPLREIEPGIHMLELFHGPTHAFKDIGARFMARTMAALRDEAAPPLTILTATSGDTGGAVAHAFHGLPGIRVVVLYPLGRVSPRQEAQFATLGGNVTAVAVRGVFDDCQRLARQAFADRGLNARLSLTSANSINIGRLLPQTFYYVHALTELARTAPDRELVVSVPSGNFGNLTAGLIARRALGMSLARFVAATNENSVVPEYLAGCGFHPRPSVETISSAMDVGDPSNFRRIVHLFGGDGEGGGGTPGGPGIPDATPGGTDLPVGEPGPAMPADTPGPDPIAASRLRLVLTGSCWTDRETRDCIRGLWRQQGIAIDPHTAVGLLGLRRELRRRSAACGVVLATAHPAKFAETVEPLIGQTLPIPPGIARVMDRPRRSIEVDPELAAVRKVLLHRSGTTQM